MTRRLFLLACLITSASAAAATGDDVDEAVAAAERNVRSHVAHLREVELRIKKSLGLAELEASAGAAARDAKSHYEELAGPIRAVVRDSDRYRALQERLRLAEAHLSDVRRSPGPAEEITAALGILFKARLELEELENRAVLDDDGVAAAYARLKQAEDRLARIRQQIHSACLDDADWSKANERLEQARKRLADLVATMNAERSLVKPLR